MVSAVCTGYQSPIPYTVTPPSTAVLFCSDGRLGEHIDEFMSAGLGIVDFDRIAIPGGAACLAGHWETWRDEEALGAQLRFLIAAHALRRVIIVAHPACGHFLPRPKLFAACLTDPQRRDLIPCP